MGRVWGGPPEHSYCVAQGLAPAVDNAGDVATVPVGSRQETAKDEVRDGESSCG